MVKLIGVMIVTFILVVPFHAEAACAWVLWDHETVTARGKSDERWIIRETWADEAPCRASLDARVRQAAEQGALLSRNAPLLYVHQQGGPGRPVTT